jgi:3-hydroxyacyl-CoA dehydrogenase
VEIRTIAIVGTTDLGCKIAYTAARAGYRTILEDISPVALERGIAWISRAISDDAARGKISSEVRDSALANLSGANLIEDASRDADLIIETVSDEMEMKLELFTIFDRFAKPGAIFASTTHSLSITEISDVTLCAERCIRMRFSATALGKERLELVKGRETSAETVAACSDVGRSMGCEVSVSSEEHVPSSSEGN